MTIAPPSRQLSLLTIAPSYHITKNAQARNAYGTVAAELTCAALQLQTIPINGTYQVCFDACDSNTFYEIKSVKRGGGKVVIYDWRMEKEESAAVPLSYAILCHNVRGSTGTRLVQEMIEGGLELIVLPAATVHSLARLSPLHTLLKPTSGKTRCGYNRAGYVRGYRNVPVRNLKNATTISTAVKSEYCGLKFSVTLFQ